MEEICQEKELKSLEIDLFSSATSPQPEEPFAKGSVDSIHRQRRQFAATRTANLSRYLERERTPHANPRLVVLNGWAETSRPSPNELLPPQLLHNLLKENNDSLVRCGGYWLQLGGVGIAINPGLWFLERFHRAGLHIWDIDHVIVTDGKESAYSDVERLWTFNKEINTLLKEWKLAPHVISYWLHGGAFERSIPSLRPVFREERSCVHRLETFHETQGFETIDLNGSCAFDYRPSASNSQKLSPLMIRFRTLQGDKEAAKPENAPQTSVQGALLGFLSQAPYDETQNEFFSSCATLVLGIGETPFEEIASLKENQTSLGYSGAIKILSNTRPRLAIISEQGLFEGDIRIESLKSLRQELHPITPTILPAEEALSIYLDSLHMTASGLDTPTPVQTVRTMRSQGPYSRLSFLDESSVL